MKVLVKCILDKENNQFVYKALTIEGKPENMREIQNWDF